MKTRQIKPTFRTALAALLVLAVAAVAGCGGDAPAETVGNPTDRAFVAAMVPHHESAIDMAAVAAREGDSSFVRNLAADITRSQNAEIEAMRDIDARLADAGIEQGRLGMSSRDMGMDMAMSADGLRGAEPFDDEFIAMMVPHHEGAIEMARMELARGGNPELKQLAQEIIADQEREVKAMRDAADAGA